MSAPETLFDIDGPFATLTFNRPEARNAMTWGMYDALAAACDRVDADANVRVFILKGAGGKAFASGTDISQFQAFTEPSHAIEYEKRISAILGRLERVIKPTIAQIDRALTRRLGKVGGRFADHRVVDLGHPRRRHLQRPRGRCHQGAAVKGSELVPRSFIGDGLLGR